MDIPQPLIHAPAPWKLQGRAYITALRYPAGLPDSAAFVPKALHGQRQPSPWAWMMYVDYAQSPVGPYHELLFMPGVYRFPDGHKHLTISRIFVSSMDSVVNGNRNWGIPKQLADFEVHAVRRGQERIRVSREGRSIADLHYQSWPLPLPLLGGLAPARWRRISQYEREQTYIYSPSAHGIAMPGRLRAAQCDPREFPAVSPAHAVLTVKLPHFRMQFPSARLVGQCADTPTDEVIA